MHSSATPGAILGVQQRARLSGTEEIVVGVIFAAVGLVLLAYNRRLYRLYEQMARSPWMAGVSAYLLPFGFAVAGVVMIVRGGAS